MILNIFVIILLVKVDKIISDASYPKSPSLYYNNLSPHEFVSLNHMSSLNPDSMKSHIKSILNISTENQTMDEYIKNYFRIDNPNPAYVFMLPDQNNRTLVFRRSDFIEMNFPKVPAAAANKFFNKTFNVSSVAAMLDTTATEFVEQITPEKLIQHKFDDYLFDNVTSDGDDAVLMENIRTERNFIKMMRDINDHPESFTKNPIIANDDVLKLQPIAVSLKNVRSKDSYKARSRRYETVVKPPASFYSPSNRRTTHKYKVDSLEYENDNDDVIDYNSDWDELGLEGWSGGIRSAKSADEFVVERPPRTETFLSNIDIAQPENYPAQFNFQKPIRPKKTLPHHVTPRPRSSPQRHTTASTKSIKAKSNHSPGIPNKYQPKLNIDSHNVDAGDSDVNRQAISEQLSLILAEERKKIKQKYNKTEVLGGSIGVPTFPVTNSRERHLNEDVFIARANNPFGHSTKWKLNNSSSKAARVPEKSNSTENEREARTKRGVIELYSMIKCGTGCDPLIYKGYGCYCGFLGSGRALDGIDKCCAMHDYCYSVSSCPMFLEYFVPYLWKCYKGRPLCAIDHGEWGGPDSCAARLCECDRVLAKCLRQYYCPHTRAVCQSSPWRLFQNFIMDFGS